MKGHICNLPMYWAPLVAVGTTFSCADCERVWWINQDSKWESEEHHEWQPASQS